MFGSRLLVIMRVTMCGVFSLGALSLSGHAQSAQLAKRISSPVSYTPHMTFDVATIRESREGNTSYIDNPNSSYFHGERLSVWGLIITAYDIPIGKLLENLPRWAGEIHLNVTAKSDAATDETLSRLSEPNVSAEKRHMLQQLLAERFQLRIHSESRIAATYELVRTKRTDFLMKPVTGDIGKTIGTCYGQYSVKGTEILSRGCPFSVLSGHLQQVLGAPMLDNTGLSGMYAFHLTWDPLPLRPEAEDRYPDLPTALREQLGLELKKTKGPVTFWVVDHLERLKEN